MPTGNAVSAFLLSLGMGLMFASLTFIAPVRVVIRFTPVRSRSSPTFFSLDPMGGQASGDAARFWAGRPVRTKSHLPKSFRANRRTGFFFCQHA
jgi:hypothetical protein